MSPFFFLNQPQLLNWRVLTEDCTVLCETILPSADFFEEWHTEQEEPYSLQQTTAKLPVKRTTYMDMLMSLAQVSISDDSVNVIISYYKKDSFSLLCDQHVLLLQLLDLALKIFLLIFQTLHRLFLLLTDSGDLKNKRFKDRCYTSEIRRVWKKIVVRGTKLSIFSSSITLSCSIYKFILTLTVQYGDWLAVTWLVLQWGLRCGAYPQDRGPLNTPGS